MLGRPVTGRVFFEQVDLEDLDLGRPDQVSLIFDRHLIPHRATPNPRRLLTRVITARITPNLPVDYKHASIKEYPKERPSVTHRDHHQCGHRAAGPLGPTGCERLRLSPGSWRRRPALPGGDGAVVEEPVGSARDYH